jgi:multidrug efflux pump subunit AcrB
MAGRSAWLDQLLRVVLSGGLPLLLIAIFLLVGSLALMMTAREEEPQIVVPMVDVMVSAPGLSARQIERQITTPLEKLLAQIKGVENIYSTSQPGQAVVKLRFYVGQNREESLLNTYTKLYSHTDQIPSAVASWVVKPVEVDDVPIVMLGLWSDKPKLYDDYKLRRMAEEVAIQLQALPNTNRVEIVGGRPRQLQLLLDTTALAARSTTPVDIVQALQATNRQQSSGEIYVNNQAIILEGGQFLQGVSALQEMVVNVVDGRPVYLQEVAQVFDGPAEVNSYSWLALGEAHQQRGQFGADYPLVTIAVAKQRGSNAVWVAEALHRKIAQLQQDILPAEVHLQVLRDYGETANGKVNDLVSSLVIAVLTVVVFIGLFLGWRPALVVGLAIPLCYGATLAINMATGYTINRVTLFALILALGLLVDDPITGIDNIERFDRRRRRLEGKKYSGINAIIDAMQEIRTPLLMSTLTIILAFVPLAFITGMMGPYMAPMALNVPITVVMSTLIAFLVTPWLAYLVFVSKKSTAVGDAGAQSKQSDIYTVLLKPLIASRRRAGWFLFGVFVLFVVTAILPVFRMVPLKLLPFDNKNELQVVIDLPEGSTLEQTQAVAQQVQQEVLRLPEVTAVAAYAGIASPMDFNGLVRQYYLRQGSRFADLRITLVDKQQRSHQSHAILLRLRPAMQALEETTGAKIKLVEMPPGPPVLSTLVAEVYGSATSTYQELLNAAAVIEQRLAKEEGVVDIDSIRQADQQRWRFVPDRQKAALSGISSDDIASTLVLANTGYIAGYLQDETEVNPLPIVLRLPQVDRADIGSVLSLAVRGRYGVVQQQRGQGLEPAPQPLVMLAELGDLQLQPSEQAIYHKDLRPVVYVMAETAGRPPAEVIADLVADQNTSSETYVAVSDRHYFNNGAGIPWQVADDIEVSWSGEGEWKITVRVFRDMGIGFAVALLGIFFVLRVQTASNAISLIIMSAIPLTIIGIMPGFWLLNQLGEREVAGAPDPVLFTATAMIGMIALAGIVVRNSLILVEFIDNALRHGSPLKEALLEAGSIRMRPVLLTAGTTLLGNLVIILDPVFSGLAWSIIFGIVASTVFTLLVIPCVYYLVFAKAESAKKGVQQ